METLAAATVADGATLVDVEEVDIALLAYTVEAEDDTELVVAASGVAVEIIVVVAVAGGSVSVLCVGDTALVSSEQTSYKDVCFVSDADGHCACRHTKASSPSV